MILRKTVIINQKKKVRYSYLNDVWHCKKFSDKQKNDELDTYEWLGKVKVFQWTWDYINCKWSDVDWGPCGNVFFLCNRRLYIIDISYPLLLFILFINFINCNTNAFLMNPISEVQRKFKGLLHYYLFSLLIILS